MYIQQDSGWQEINKKRTKHQEHASVKSHPRVRKIPASIAKNGLVKALPRWRSQLRRGPGEGTAGALVAAKERRRRLLGKP
jgi:hypothetical protein